MKAASNSYFILKIFDMKYKILLGITLRNICYLRHALLYGLANLYNPMTKDTTLCSPGSMRGKSWLYLRSNFEGEYDLPLRASEIVRNAINYGGGGEVDLSQNSTRPESLLLE